MKRTPVAKVLARRIADHGPIPFAEFMERALYGAGGYYAVERPPIGRRGDFITGSRSRLFAAATHRLLAALDRDLGARAQMLEVGYGDGRHLGHLVELGRRDVAGHDRVRRPLPPGVEWRPDLVPGSVRGLVFSYELFDAQPVHRLIGREGGFRELWVGIDEEAEPERPFVWCERPPSTPALTDLVAGVDPVDGQIVDVAPAVADLYRQLAATLEEGLLVTCDYGYRRARLMDPRVRRHGTLACYRDHTVHRDPFVDVGRQDLTAHVDFTTLTETGEAAGLCTLGFFKLAEWLTGLGIFDDLQGADRSVTEEAQRLLDPAGMGSEIKVLVQARGEIELANLGVVKGELS